MEIIPSQKSFRSYLFLWSGQLFSLFGSSIVYFAIIWWITIETKNPIFLSIASTLYILSSVIVLPFAGVLSDRLNKKQLIIIADSSQVIATIVLIVYFAFGLANIYVVFIIISVRSIFQAIHLPTVNSIIPAMVPKDKLTRINGINYLFTGLVDITAPFAGAALLLVFLVYQVLWLDLITFGIAIIPLLIVQIPSVHNVKEKVKNSFLKEFNIGFKTLRLIPGLFIIIIYVSKLFDATHKYVIALLCKCNSFWGSIRLRDCNGIFTRKHGYWCVNNNPKETMVSSNAFIFYWVTYYECRISHVCVCAHRANIDHWTFSSSICVLHPNSEFNLYDYGSICCSKR